jgi:16S rRNA (guanine966-N2)-methyltransferase
MRVIGGSARGMRLESVPGDSTRPILDRVRTALFDILRPRISGVVMLDVFGGSGSVGIEALSQGAAHCTFLDVNNAAFKTIKSNLAHTKLDTKATVYNTDAFSYLRRTKESFDLIYVAPPQFEGMWLEALRTIAERPDLLKQGGQIIAQIDPSEYEALTLECFEEVRQQKYGKTLLVFIERRIKSL